MAERRCFRQYLGGTLTFGQHAEPAYQLLWLEERSEAAVEASSPSAASYCLRSNRAIAPGFPQLTDYIVRNARRSSVAVFASSDSAVLAARRRAFSKAKRIGVWAGARRSRPGIVQRKEDFAGS